MMKKILLIEDDELTLKVIEFQLQKQGFQIISDTEGSLFNDYCNSVDFIVLDCNLLFFKPSEKLADYNLDTPVIFISSSDEELEEVKKLNLQKTIYLKKPLNAKDILNAINTFV